MLRDAIENPVDSWQKNGKNAVVSQCRRGTSH
jgi:hypothetical protein